MLQPFSNPEFALIEHKEFNPFIVSVLFPASFCALSGLGFNIVSAIKDEYDIPQLGPEIIAPSYIALALLGLLVFWLVNRYGGIDFTLIPCAIFAGAAALGVGTTILHIVQLCTDVEEIEIIFAVTALGSFILGFSGLVLMQKTAGEDLLYGV